MIPYFSIPPIRVFGLSFHVFGFMVSMGFIVATRVAAYWAEKEKLSGKVVYDISLLCIIAGIFGAHIFHVFAYEPDKFIKNPFYIFQIWSGLSSFGGMLGASLAIWIYCIKNKISFLRYADVIIRGLAPGWMVGRIGCAVAHDHMGSLSNFILAIRFPGGARHDLGFYEVFVWLFIMLAQYWLSREGPSRKFSSYGKGFMLGFTMALYAPFRFFLDSLRAVDISNADIRYIGLTPRTIYFLGIFWTGFVFNLESKVQQKAIVVIGFVLVVSILCIVIWQNKQREDDVPGVRYSFELKRKIKNHMKNKNLKAHHTNEDGSPKYTNRLIQEESPYLLQHAHNPVNWYPWGDEAFEEAKKQKRPVLLSVGYATCHWCHVMERESFEDEQIAEYINTHYIPIKVDREQRPDIDSIYMAAVQAISGSGGWPMTVWLTPEKKPYFGGTYFPPRDGDRGTRLGFLSMLKHLYAFYQEEPLKVEAQSIELAKAIRSQLLPEKTDQEIQQEEVFTEGYRWFESIYDATQGGFGGAPKFPRPVVLDFIQYYNYMYGGEQAKKMVQHTLEKMEQGGLYDQIGGGFHRYAVDRIWLVPHFEKMLYDNAQLAISYIEAYQIHQKRRI